MAMVFLGQKLRESRASIEFVFINQFFFFFNNFMHEFSWKYIIMINDDLYIFIVKKYKIDFYSGS